MREIKKKLSSFWMRDTKGQALGFVLAENLLSKTRYAYFGTHNGLEDWNAENEIMKNGTRITLSTLEAMVRGLTQPKES